MELVPKKFFLVFNAPKNFFFLAEKDRLKGEGSLEGKMVAKLNFYQKAQKFFLRFYKIYKARNLKC